MQAIKIRLLVLIIVLIIGVMMSSFLSRETYVSGMNRSHLNDFPLYQRGWIGEKISLEQKVYDILETDALVLNRYVKQGKSVTLAIVYYPDAKISFHAPEECYGGKGVNIVKEVQEIIVKEFGLMSVNVLTIDRGSSKELVYYFFKAGGFMGHSYNRLRLNLIKNNLLSKEKSGALIRISTLVISDINEASSSLLLYLNDFMPLFKTYM